MCVSQMHYYMLSPFPQDMYACMLAHVRVHAEERAAIARRISRMMHTAARD